MTRDAISRRLLAALAGSTPAFTPIEVTSDRQDAGRRLLAALAGSTPAFRSADPADEYTSQPVKSIEIRVSRQVLWIGSKAYPLRNITRVSTLALEPMRGAAMWAYLKTVIGWIVSATIAGVTLALGTDWSAGPVLVAIGVLALILVKTIRLVALLNRTLYALIIETSLWSHQALVSKDANLVSDLVVQITSAIDNPDAAFQLRVANLHFENNIIAARSVGKTVD